MSRICKNVHPSSAGLGSLLYINHMARVGMKKKKKESIALFVDCTSPVEPASSSRSLRPSDIVVSKNGNFQSRGKLPSAFRLSEDERKTSSARDLRDRH